MNETNFRINYDRSRIIITFDKKINITNLNNRDYCINVKIINVVKKIISFLLIMKNIHVLYI